MMGHAEYQLARSAEVSGAESDQLPSFELFEVALMVTLIAAVHQLMSQDLSRAHQALSLVASVV